MGKSTLLLDNPSLAKEWHPTKNGFLTPQDLKHKSAKKVWWLCKKYNTHEWKASVFSRTYGAGCPYCAIRAVSPQNCLLTMRPEVAKEWHPTKNGSLTPKAVTSKSNKRAWWLCKKDRTHEWEAVISSRTDGAGCPICYKMKWNKAK